MTDIYDINGYKKYVSSKEQPPVILWNGRTANDLDWEFHPKTQIYSAGIYNCSDNNGRLSCDNSKGVINDIDDGIVIPPNMNVFIWGDNVSDTWDRPYGIIDYTPVGQERTLSVPEGQGGWKDLCPEGSYVADIKSAVFQCQNGDTRNSDVKNQPAVRHLYRERSYPFPNDLYEWLDSDPCGGQSKVLNLKYQCGSGGTVIPQTPPNGVYGPGIITFPDDFSSGVYYGQRKDIPYGLQMNNINARIGRNDTNTVMIRQIQPWSDHLKDCCDVDPESKNKDSTKCGDYYRKSLIGAKKCGELYLNDCSADDIKLGGKCYDMCEANPDICDKIKINYCQQNPSNSFCDCINYSTSQTYNDFLKKHPTVRIAYPRCISTRCASALDDVFLTDQIKTDLKVRCSNITYTDQSVNISGEGNVANVNQTANITTGGQSNGQTGNQSGTNVNTQDSTTIGDKNVIQQDQTINVNQGEKTIDNGMPPFQNPLFNSKNILILLIVIIIIIFIGRHRMNNSEQRITVSEQR